MWQTGRRWIRLGRILEMERPIKRITVQVRISMKQCRQSEKEERAERKQDADIDLTAGNQKDAKITPTFLAKSIFFKQPPN